MIDIAKDKSAREVLEQQQQYLTTLLQNVSQTIDANGAAVRQLIERETEVSRVSEHHSARVLSGQPIHTVPKTLILLIAEHVLLL